MELVNFMERRKTMQFNWNMTEEEWKRMIDEHINHKDNSNNVYGNLYVGKLCLVFCHTKDESAWYLYVSVFEIGKDTGYGYTVEGNIPYDLLDNDIKVPVRCKTFNSFKKEVEKRVRKMVIKDGLEEQVSTELANWI